jgi:CheY-like chemotaxis protein
MKRDVLVVDDDDAIRTLMSIALKRKGLNCGAARDGIDALEQVHESEYSVVLLDLMMPRLDGLSFLKRLRDACVSTPLPMVIVMTAFPEGDLPETPELVQAVIRKPFDVHEVADLVRGCVDLLRTRDEPSIDQT